MKKNSDSHMSNKVKVIFDLTNHDAKKKLQAFIHIIYLLEKILQL